MICNSDSPERFPAARTRAQDNNSDDSFPIANGRNGQQEISVATPLEFLFLRGGLLHGGKGGMGLKEE